MQFTFYTYTNSIPSSVFDDIRSYKTILEHITHHTHIFNKDITRIPESSISFDISSNTTMTINPINKYSLELDIINNTSIINVVYVPVLYGIGNEFLYNIKYEDSMLDMLTLQICKPTKYSINSNILTLSYRYYTYPDIDKIKPSVLIDDVFYTIPIISVSQIINTIIIELDTDFTNTYTKFINKITDSIVSVSNTINYPLYLTYISGKPCKLGTIDITHNILPVPNVLCYMVKSLLKDSTEYTNITNIKHYPYTSIYFNKKLNSFNTITNKYLLDLVTYFNFTCNIIVNNQVVLTTDTYNNMIDEISLKSYAVNNFKNYLDYNIKDISLEIEVSTQLDVILSCKVLYKTVINPISVSYSPKLDLETLTPIYDISNYNNPVILAGYTDNELPTQIINHYIDNVFNSWDTESLETIPDVWVFVDIRYCIYYMDDGYVYVNKYEIGISRKPSIILLGKHISNININDNIVYNNSYIDPIIDIFYKYYYMETSVVNIPLIDKMYYLKESKESSITLSDTRFLPTTLEYNKLYNKPKTYKYKGAEYDAIVSNYNKFYNGTDELADIDTVLTYLIEPAKNSNDIDKVFIRTIDDNYGYACLNTNLYKDYRVMSRIHINLLDTITLPQYDTNGNRYMYIPCTFDNTNKLEHGIISDFKQIIPTFTNTLADYSSSPRVGLGMLCKYNPTQDEVYYNIRNNFYGYSSLYAVKDGIEKFSNNVIIYNHTMVEDMLGIISNMLVSQYVIISEKIHYTTPIEINIDDSVIDYNIPDTIDIVLH